MDTSLNVCRTSYTDAKEGLVSSTKETFHKRKSEDETHGVFQGCPMFNFIPTVYELIQPMAAIPQTFITDFLHLLVQSKLLDLEDASRDSPERSENHIRDVKKTILLLRKN